MTSPAAGQRNPYKGRIHPRAWVRVTLLAADGTGQQCELIADTGCPFDLVIDTATLTRLQERPDGVESSSYGLLATGVLRVRIPEVGIDQQVRACASDDVVHDAQADDPDFAGLIGLPVLRLTDYGGDANWFWIRPAGTGP